MSSNSSAAGRSQARAKVLPNIMHRSPGAGGGWPATLANRRLAFLAATGAAALVLGMAVQTQMQRLGMDRGHQGNNGAARVSSSPVQFVPPLAQPRAGTAAGAQALAPSTNTSVEPGIGVGPNIITAHLDSPAGKIVVDAASRVADTITLQQVRTLMAAPPPATQTSTQALSDLAALVRQAQVSTQSAALLAAGATGAQVADSPAVRDGITAVQQAEAELEAAVSARDAAALAAPPQSSAPATGSPTTAGASQNTAPAQATSVSAPVSGRLAAPAAPIVSAQQIQQARADVLNAQASLNAVLAPPPADQVAGAQQAISNALASVPMLPSDVDIQNAQVAVDHARQVYELALQPQVANAIALSQGAGTTRSGAAAAGQSGAAASNTVPQNPAAMAEQAKASLQAAQDRLTTLQQQAAHASNPDSDPQVIAARTRLAVLQAPPDAQRVAAAQNGVVAAEHRLTLQLTEAMQPVPAPVASTAIAAAAGANPTSAAGVVAATPNAALQQLDEAVTAAKTKLADAQGRVRDAVTASLPASPPAGSTVTNVTPQIGAAASAVSKTSDAGSASALAVELGLRASIVEDAGLLAMGLHPSAFPIPKIATPPPAASKMTSPFLWPVTGPITQPFGVPELGVGAPHTGVDIGVPVGTAVRATAPGVVSFAGGDPTSSYGYYVIVDHGQGVTSLYGHLAMEPLVLPGQLVLQGTLLGLSGSTGISTGPHVHFEIRLNAAPADPLRLLPGAS